MQVTATLPGGSCKFTCCSLIEVCGYKILYVSNEKQINYVYCIQNRQAIYYDTALFGTMPSSIVCYSRPFCNCVVFCIDMCFMGLHNNYGAK